MIVWDLQIIQCDSWLWEIGPEVCDTSMGHSDDCFVTLKVVFRVSQKVTLPDQPF